MKREIKFRGKENQNSKWIYGDLFQYNDGTICIGERNDKQSDEIDVNPYYDNVSDVDKETIGQYTGLKDKNGTEIYEGDIVQWEECVADYTFVTQKSEVFYNESSASFEPLNEFDYCDFEVIGNIYDNKELLEE